MRSGLRKPGAIPFVALILFSILSLVPSLAKEWDFYNLQIGYRGLSRNEVRHLSPMQDGAVDIRPRTRSIGPHCKSWPGCKMHPRRASLDASPISAVETATIKRDPIPLAVTRPSSLARGVRAFTTFFIKSWYQYQIPPPMSTKSAPTAASRSLPPLANSSLMPETHTNEEQRGKTNQSTANPKYFLEQYRIALGSIYHDVWQQVCRVTIESIEHLFVPKGAVYPSNSSIPGSEFRTNPSFAMDLEDRALSLKGANLQPNPPDMLAKSNPLFNETTTAAGQSEVARVDPEPKKMRGSCMAIVIGLVACVIWF